LGKKEILAQFGGKASETRREAESSLQHLDRKGIHTIIAEVLFF